jgi:hypothetical protein
MRPTTPRDRSPPDHGGNRTLALIFAELFLNI